jgi:HAD superfamily hydrolase (TIGR01509 family)
VTSFAAVLFDMDGVLIDSEPVWEDVRRRLVERLGGHWTDDMQRQMMGVRTDVWSSAFSDLVGRSLGPSAIVDLVIDDIAAEYRRHLPLIDGAADAVRNLARDFPLGLVSGSPRKLIDLTLRLADLTACFRTVMSTDEISRGKPAPDPYVELAHRLGFEPAACVAVEDSTNGLRSALAAQARVVAIPRGEHLPDEETLGLADAVLETIKDLTPARLQGLGATKL